MKQQPKIYGHAGELITCENGHPIAKLVNDVGHNDILSVEAFDWLTAEKPEPFSEVKPCPVCNAAWYNGTMHFADGGWRTSDTEL